MTLFIIDTARAAYWSEATTLPIRKVCSEPEGTQWELKPDDFVFAHAHNAYTDHNPDLVLNQTNFNGLKVQNFCSVLVQAANEKRAPTVVLYSGGDLDPAEKQSWKALAVAFGGPLNGFPEDRIHFYHQTIVRPGNAEILRDMVEEVIAACHRDETDRTITLDTAWLDEAKLAARLLIEASELPTDKCHGITISRPPDDLVALAKAVVEASDNRQTLALAAKTLCDKLSSL